MAIIVTYTSHNEQKTCFWFWIHEKALFERRQALPSAHARAPADHPRERQLGSAQGLRPPCQARCISSNQRPGQGWQAPSHSNTKLTVPGI